eukprot:c18899_g1_i2.p3 GENE.c18899_g1_i2~~c18899_g1_i2.p3  ORF type:complete len:130 (+),score=16.27 c18899_g1_i2:995-1384(+)
MNLCARVFSEPFRGFYTIESDSKSDVRVSCVPDWLTRWRSSCANLTSWEQLWQGDRFRSHPVWLSGMRSLFLVVSLDWFPPFKNKNYSLGVLSVSVGNLNCTERAKSTNVWVIAVLEDPKEPKHTGALL